MSKKHPGSGNHKNHRNLTILERRERAAGPNGQIYNNVLTLQRQNDIMAMLLEGKHSDEIKSYIIGKYKVGSAAASDYLKKARNALTERKNFEVDNLVTLHLARYEWMYEKLYAISSLGYAAKVLQAKEKLMGFHKEGFHMKVTQGEITALQLQQVNDEYDVMKLDEDKRKRLNVLLNKAKRK